MAQPFTHVQFYNVKNINGMQQTVTDNIFPAQSQASAKQLYSLENCLTEVIPLHYLEVRYNDYSLAYEVTLTNGEILEFSIDNAKCCDTEWECSAMQKAFFILENECARKLHS